MEKPTLPDDTASRAGPPVEAPEALALVVAWCPREPRRVGEVLVVPTGDPGPMRVFGRGPSQPNDPHPRLHLFRDRPWGPEPTPPLSLERVSRVQLRLSSRGPDCLALENLGQRKLRRRGVVVRDVLLTPGETIEIGKQILFFCARRRARLGGERGPLDPTEFGKADPAGIVGESPASWELRRAIVFIASKEGHVLLTGASGTGKELAARAVHTLSPRASGPFVARSAATLPESIIDAELFGNAKNYPNAGTPERTGLVGQASGGTLLLDEFAELSPSLQAHLLRVLDGGEYHRLGEAVARMADVRLIAATNRDETTLKHDLLARLMFRIELPDLNARREDVPLIAEHLLNRIADDNPDVSRRYFDDEREPRIAIELVRSLLEHEYTAHVRELEHLLWRSIEESPGDTLVPSSAVGSARPGSVTAVLDGASDLTAARIQACLDANNGALEPTWRALGLRNRHALSRLIVKHCLELRRRPGHRSGGG